MTNQSNYKGSSEIWAAFSFFISCSQITPMPTEPVKAGTGESG
jgi:hypothetical protein